MSIGDQIRAARLEQGLDQRDLAARAGVSQSQICHIEGGKRVPSVRLLVRIALVLRSSVDRLLADEISEMGKIRLAKRVWDRLSERGDDR